MSGEAANRADLAALVQAPVVAAERARWGFENTTDIVTLADGRRLVVQRITRRPLASLRLRLASMLPAPLAAVGICAPRVLAADPRHDPPYAVREHIPGDPGNTLLGSDESAMALARAMGVLLPRLAATRTEGLDLPDTWADPLRLAGAASGWLAACGDLSEPPARAAVAEIIGRVAALFDGRPAAFAHGDYCPVNVLVGAGPAVVALLDFEQARLADRLLDAAWWGWVVRHHHPERWRAAWPHLLAAAGIADDEATRERVRALQVLRLLEALDEARRYAPGAAQGWAARLAATLRWPGN